MRSSQWLSGVLGFLVALTVSADPVRPGMAGKLIEHYRMQLVPEEGVWFALSYLSADRIGGAALPERYAGRAHAAGNAIVALATPQDFAIGYRDELQRQYPGFAADIARLTRAAHAHR
jgi:hypothetical protein